MSIIEKFDGKTVLIWGYGIEGKSTEKFLKNFCNASKIDIFEGKADKLEADKYDLIVKSPGIPGDYPDEKFTSQTELFLEEFRERTIGITGTKGKSTTTSMLYKVLSNMITNRVVLVGNIGIPCLDYYEEMSSDSQAIAVMEMSCHQLNNVKVSPHFAVFLNLYEEHLDYYGTFEKYMKAKNNIAKFQIPGDKVFVGESVPRLDTRGLEYRIPEFEERKYDLKILGQHNQWNAEFVKKVCVSALKLNEDDVISEIEKFEGLPHRLEFIGNVDGIDYYDDSISTIPLACINACKSIPNIKIAIIGGMDRGIGYEELIDYIKKEPDIIFLCAYATGERIYEEANRPFNCKLVKDIDEALEVVLKYAEPGDAVVLSPAAASYGYFKNFAERGEYFKQRILESAK
ncbi:MAG: UDP-N-acetylmuramoyl-L-alanine--D-glutamate ligase [Lachnospiraceae bacterium]|nr:UDP-N-acetylmuramoyl-L-alanine--D-glutamate ligase [Lachnospiraceae bacterium]